MKSRTLSQRLERVFSGVAVKKTKQAQGHGPSRFGTQSTTPENGRDFCRTPPEISAEHPLKDPLQILMSVHLLARTSGVKANQMVLLQQLFSDRWV